MPSQLSNLSIGLTLNKYWKYWCPHTDSNREPTDYKSVALPVES